MSKSLLPFNTTQQEKNIETVLERTNDIPVLIHRVWDPRQCPVNLLPWLAWALSIDTWDSEWPETTKRNLIAESIRIHRTKGTVSAIERVLSALGVDAELTEWFENNGAPHTFQLLAWANANLVPDADVILSPVLYRTLKQSIDDVKPIRSHYEFQVGAAFGGDMGMVCSATSSSTTRVKAEPESDIGFNVSAIAPGAQIMGMTTIRISMAIS